MIKIINKIKIIMGVALLGMLIMPLTVKAGYQANKGGYSKYDTANNHFVAIRNMESGVLNKTMTLETPSYKDTSGNGIDCHMAKNTEWGTAAMLAVSAYGGNPSAKDDTTTKNLSGIYYMVGGSGFYSNTNNRYEYVAGIHSDGSNSSMTTIKAADQRYYDSYTDSSSSYHKGDATRELGWIISGNWVSSSKPVFYWGYDSYKFGFSCDSGWNSGYGSSSQCSYGARAVVVCGEGL